MTGARGGPVSHNIMAAKPFLLHLFCGADMLEYC